MSLDFNFNFNLKNVTLDKLFKEVSNTPIRTDLSYNQDVSVNNFSTSTNKYGGVNTSQTETLNLSPVGSENKVGNVNISNSNNNFHNNLNSSNDGTQNLNSYNMNNSNPLLNKDNNGTNKENSGYNFSGNQMESQKDNGLNTNEKTNNSIEFKNSGTSTSSSTVNNSGNVNADGLNIKLNNAPSNVDASKNNNIELENANGVIDNNNEVISTGIKMSLSNALSSVEVNNFVISLKNYGLRTEDINRVLNGSITLESLMQEIENDDDISRRKEIMEASYLSAYNLDVFSMEDLLIKNNKLEAQIKELIQEKNEVDNSRELEALLNIITRLRNGANLDDILSSQVVAWRYIDKDGNVCYTYNDPYVNRAVESGITYTPLLFEEMYQDSTELKKLREVLTKDRWEDNSEQQQFFNELANKYNEDGYDKNRVIENLNNEIEKLQQELLTNKYIYENIEREVNYYFNHIEIYISNDDFNLHKNYIDNSSDVINKLKENYEGASHYHYSTPTAIINDKEKVIEFLGCLINGKLEFENGLLLIDGTKFIINSNDDLLKYYMKWIPFISETEKDIFNYVYNTSGYEGAYKYLESVSEEFDNRWLINKTQEDQEFAREHPVLASVGSIFITPMEGMSAFYYSINSLINNEKIKRTDVYSSGNVWRSQVAADIAKNYGEGWSFLYSTGMSMADSATLIAISAATGGTATPVLSATLMGSRVYVSVLNDALDRGLSDGQAVGLAFTSAVVESAMESYSLGHLMNLETKLGANTSKLVARVGELIPNERLAKIATKTTYIMSSAINQGIAEGEEEFATEILNFVFDDLISGDLSNYSLTIDNYISLGYSEEEARRLANVDFCNQLGQAFLGGFVSGVCFGSFGGITTTHNVSKNIANDIQEKYSSSGGKRFDEIIELNMVQDEMVNKNSDGTKYDHIKEITINLKNAISEITNASTVTSMMSLKKTVLGVSVSIPSFINKFKSAPLINNEVLLNKVQTEGLLHITTESAISKILDSGYVKASNGFLTSYGNPKSFFFSGIPSFYDVCSNIKYLEKAVAVRIKPSIEKLSDGNFNYRVKDDQAITYSGDFYFEPGTAEIVYFGLDVNENNEFFYKEITPEEYINYVPNFFSITRNAPKLIRELSNSIKTNILGISYQYEVFKNNLDKKFENADRIGIDGLSEADMILKDENFGIYQNVQNQKYENEYITLKSENYDDMGKYIPLNKLLDVLQSKIKFWKINYDLLSNEKIDSSDFTKLEYLEAFVQLYHAVKNNQYDLNLSSKQLDRLEQLYNKGLTSLPISKINYDYSLPNNIKLSIMFSNKKIYDDRDLNLLYSYYNHTFSLENLFKNPSWIVSEEYLFYQDVFSEYHKESMKPFTNEEISFWGNFNKNRQIIIDFILKNNINIGEHGFNKFLSSIVYWSNELRNYVDYYSSIYKPNVKNLNYDANMPVSLKLELMREHKKIYDEVLLINEMEKNLSNNISPLIICDELYWLYYNTLSKYYNVGNNKYEYYYNMCEKIYRESLAYIINNNVQLSEKEFMVFMRELGNNINIVRIQNYIAEYLKIHDIDVSDYLTAMLYDENMPVVLRKIIYNKILENYDWYLSGNSNQIYGVDQNATAPYMTMIIKNLDWLDENEFINYLVNNWEYNQTDAQNLCNDIKNMQGKVINQRYNSIIIEYIYDRCLKENRYDIISFIYNSFSYNFDSEFMRLINKLENLGMSWLEAVRTLSAIDSTGCCSYAAVLNGIYFAYRNKPDLFEKDFGYPMFIEINGIKEFNSGELMLDIYTYINSNECGGSLFVYDVNGNLSINSLETKNQIYLSGINYYGNVVNVNHPYYFINNFLNFKGASSTYVVDNKVAFLEGITTAQDITKIKQDVINFLKNSPTGSVQLDIFTTKDYKFRLLENPNKVYITSGDWDEGSGHAVCITGVIDDYFIVSSWGKRLLIPISDFVNNEFSLIFRHMEGIQ